MRTNPDRIALGSGKAYIAEYDATKGMPKVTDICKEENLLGKIKGGAELSYSIETHEEKDDLGTVAKVVVTNEEAILKLGLITFNGNTMAKLADRCKVTEDKTEGTRTLLIGGVGNAQGKEWVVCFHHHDAKDGDIWLQMRGTNQAGLTLAFATDAGSKLEPEIRGLPFDESGSLVKYIEQIAKSAT